MIEPLVPLTYIPAALALNLTPGAGVVSCHGQGPRAAMTAHPWIFAQLSPAGLVVKGAVGGDAAGRLLRSARFATVLGRVSAGIFTALALRLSRLQRG